MFDLPSQYAERIETFRHILKLPDPKDTMSRSSTIILGLDNEKGQQELRPKGPSAMLPLSPYLKDDKKAKFRRVPILKKQPGMGMKMPLTC